MVKSLLFVESQVSPYSSVFYRGYFVPSKDKYRGFKNIATKNVPKGSAIPDYMSHTPHDA